jgi:6-phosphogluconolactonase (cycloisomerase 2 family)
VTTNLIKNSPLIGQIYEHRQALAAIHGATKGAELRTKSGAEVAVRHDGRFVYVENRGENALVV